MKRSIKVKSVIQYQNQKSLPQVEGEEQERMMQKVLEDIKDLEFAVQNIISQYLDNKEIKQDFEIIEKQIYLSYNKYSCCI